MANVAKGDRVRCLSRVYERCLDGETRHSAPSGSVGVVDCVVDDRFGGCVVGSCAWVNFPGGVYARVNVNALERA